MPSKALLRPGEALRTLHRTPGLREGISGGPGAGEMLHAATIAIVGKVPIGTLWHAIPAFPTISELWLRLLEQYRDTYDVTLT